MCNTEAKIPKMYLNIRQFRLNVKINIISILKLDIVTLSLLSINRINSGPRILT